ncbi:MAG: exopolyphosphatase/guanosine-5'-triphosphate,3'-diphosphate pyrophosphatase [Pirellulaceae bacterium]|jgi:exopolyphosphatase/guanosine-5'-triphosphate,3'-diphosphate pyrophosphatase
MSSSPTAKTISSATPVAVIDIGSTSIRMAIAEINSIGVVRTLETLSQAVSLGRDTFTTGQIQRNTIENVVRTLRSYRRLISQYQIEKQEHIRVIGTSAIREAGNRLAFLDRIYSATGFDVDAIDEAEENRVTYLGIQPLLQESRLSNGNVLVMEVGGGHTDLLVVRKGNVVFSHSYRLGSLRIRKTLEAFRTPVTKSRHIMEGKIQRTIEQVREQVPDQGPIELIGLGGDMRFAAMQIIPDWNPLALGRVPRVELEALTNQMLELSEDEIVQRYHLSYPEAETIGPALLAYVMMAQAFDVVSVLVTNTNIRDGLLKEMANSETWTEDFRTQIVRSAVALANRYDVDVKHAKLVANLCQELFEKLQSEHQLPARYGIILHVAGLLHEIGLFVNSRSHHKHAMYIIKNSEIFGFGKKQLLLTALITRYHRRGSPQPKHEDYADLDRDERIAVAKLAAILRVAIALSDSRSERIRDVRCKLEKGLMVITVPNVDDLSIEQFALQQSGTLFEETFGTQVLLRPHRAK